MSDYLKLADEAETFQTWDGETGRLMDALAQAVRELVEENTNLERQRGEYCNCFHDKIIECDNLTTEIESLKEYLSEKKDIDELVGANVAHRETVAFAAELRKAEDEILRMKDVVASADARAVRWEDKVQRYGKEVEEMRAEVERLKFYETLVNVTEQHSETLAQLAPTDTYAYEMDQLKAEVVRLQKALKGE